RNLAESILEAAIVALRRLVHTANRKDSPTSGGAPPGLRPTSPHGGEDIASVPSGGPPPTFPPDGEATQNQEKPMAATVKPSSPPPAAISAITTKSLDLKQENRDLLLGMHRQLHPIRRFAGRWPGPCHEPKLGCSHP